MKAYKTLLSIILFITLNVEAQTIEQAIFKECITSTEQYKCTNERFHTDIASLLTPQLTLDLKKALPEEYFSVSLILVSNAKGKIIPSETRILCPPQLENPIKEYIDKLPILIPKSDNYIERRSAHMINVTFVYDTSTETFIEADRDDLAMLKIRPITLPLDSYPIYPGCEGFEKDAEFKCLSRSIMNFVMKNFNVPDTNYSGTMKMIVQLVVEKNGSITIDEIIGGNGSFRVEAKRVIEALPVIEPGKLSNIPVRVACILPIIIKT